MDQGGWLPCELIKLVKITGLTPAGESGFPERDISCGGCLHPKPGYAGNGIGTITQNRTTSVFRIRIVRKGQFPAYPLASKMLSPGVRFNGRHDSCGVRVYRFEDYSRIPVFPPCSSSSPTTFFRAGHFLPPPVTPGAGRNPVPAGLNRSWMNTSSPGNLVEERFVRSLPKWILALTMLSAFVLGVATANTGAPDGGGGFTTANPVALGPDAKAFMTFWNAGTEGFLNVGSSGTLSKAVTNAQIQNIPAGGDVAFNTPLSLPTNINGKPCAVRHVYLEWSAPTDCQIEEIWVFSGYQILTTIYQSVPGTNSLEKVTIDLGAYYPVSRGLSVGWTIHNYAVTPNECSVFAYGSRVRYQAA